MQGRVLFHIERVFRSAGGNGIVAHRTFLKLCASSGISTRVADYHDVVCHRVLRLIEQAARAQGMHKFRSVKCS